MYWRLLLMLPDAPLPNTETVDNAYRTIAGDGVAGSVLAIVLCLLVILVVYIVGVGRRREKEHAAREAVLEKRIADLNTEFIGVLRQKDQDIKDGYNRIIESHGVAIAAMTESNAAMIESHAKLDRIIQIMDSSVAGET